MRLSTLIDMQDNGTISGTTAKGVFEQMFETGRAPSEIVIEEPGLGQIESADEIGGGDRQGHRGEPRKPSKTIAAARRRRSSSSSAR